jgi:hypothetical protein
MKAPPLSMVNAIWPRSPTAIGSAATCPPWAGVASASFAMSAVER